MKQALFLILGIFSSLSFGENNLLIGKWEHDKELTMLSFNKSGETPRKVKLCYEKNICGHFSIEYKENTYRVIQPAINDVSDYWPYKVISSTANSITIEETNGDGEKHIYTWQIQNGIGCFELEIQGFKYNECFRKIGL